MKWLILLSLIYYLSDVKGLKVLVCFPLPVKSLSILGQGAVRHLMEAGHDVTYITVYPLKLQAKNFRQIDISSNVALVAKDETLTMGYVLNHKLERNHPYQIQEFAQEAVRMTLNHENVKKLLEDPNVHFDVIITDLMESEVYTGLAVLYNCPMVWLYSMGAHWQVLRLIDVASNPAYDPDYLSPNMPPFTFAQRVEELWSRIYWQYLKTFYTQPEERQIYEAVFGPLLAKRGRILPDYEDVIYNASLILANEHDATLNRASTPQNFKYIGGCHIEEPVKPLPKDLQDLIDNSKHGVIYFSMGSVLQSKSLPKELVTELLQMFGEFKQTIIWKFEDNSLVNVPKNVWIVNWAPQQSILETIHFGKPIIGVPVFFDQYTNIYKAVQNEYALKVPFSQNLPKDLKHAINVMLTDDRYANKAKELSALYHDRLTAPGAAFLHWVEHVVRTRGAHHLRSPARHVPLYQRLYLDLLALILTIVSVLIYILSKICKKKHVDRNDLKKRN